MIDYKNKYIKYKIKYLNLIGGVPNDVPNDVEIDLLKCSKYNIFKEKKLILDKYFTADNFEKKREDFRILSSIDKEQCFKIYINIINRSKFSYFLVIFRILNELVDLLNDFIEFIKIFSVDPYKESFLVKQISDMFKAFSFKFKISELPNFLEYFLPFLLELIKIIKVLFTNILGIKYDNIVEIDLQDFKYFSLKFDNYSFFHKKTFIFFELFIVIFVQGYQKIYLLLKDLKKSIDKMSCNYQMLFMVVINNINKIDESQDHLDNLYKIRELRLRQSIIPICIKIWNLTQDCPNFETKIKLLKKQILSDEYKNQQILDTFNKLIDIFIETDFKCSKKGTKNNIYKLLKQISDILKFVSSRKIQEQIDTKIIDAWNSLSIIQRTVISEEKDIFTLQELIDKLGDSLSKCAPLGSKIQTDFKIFKDNLNIISITDKDTKRLEMIEKEVSNLQDSYTCLFTKKKFTKIEFNNMLRDIRKILELYITK